MSNPYIELKRKHQREINAFPLGFAYNMDQFNEMMAKWNLTSDDVDKIYRIDIGTYLRKCDSEAFHELLERHTKEIETARTENKDDYLYHMFNYELANHEYNYTGELDDTLDALGLTLEEIEANPIMDEALKRAIKNQQDIDW